MVSHIVYSLHDLIAIINKNGRVLWGPGSLLPWELKRHLDRTGINVKLIQLIPVRYELEFK